MNLWERLALLGISYNEVRAEIKTLVRELVAEAEAEKSNKDRFHEWLNTAIKK